MVTIKRFETYLASDSHFFHRNIIKYCNRPFIDENEMNVEMERRWNEIVSPNDIVVYVGDLSAGLAGRKEEFASLIRRLNGRKILIRGNHDHQENSFYLENGFRKVEDSLFLEGILFVHAPGNVEHEHPHPLCKKTIELQGKHSPTLTVHGHVHAKGNELPGHHNCAMDRNDFRPFTLRSVLELNGLSSKLEEVYSALEGYVET